MKVCIIKYAKRLRSLLNRLSYYQMNNGGDTWVKALLA